MYLQDSVQQVLCLVFTFQCSLCRAFLAIRHRCRLFLVFFTLFLSSMGVV